MSFKKWVSILVVLLMIIPSLIYADYCIDTTNNLVVNNIIKGTDIRVDRVQTLTSLENEVINALSTIDFKFKEDITIHLLNYSHEKSLGLALRGNNIVIYNSLPTVIRGVTYLTVTHELGHLVYMSLSPREKLQYRKLRELPYEWKDNYRTYYVNRPQEIFAEDFRNLFGGEESNRFAHYNRNITKSSEVEGLKEFISQFSDN